MSFSLVLKDAAGQLSVYTVPVFTNVAGATWEPASDNPAVATVAMDSTGAAVVVSLVAAGDFNLTVTDSSARAPTIPAQAFHVVDIAPAAAPFAHLDLDGASSV